MNINVQTRHLKLTSELTEYVKRRIGFALQCRFDSISRVVVTLLDVNGPKGGEDMCCRILIKIDGQNNIIINDRQAHLRNAIDKAAEKASRAVSNRIERMQQKAIRIKSALRRIQPQKKQQLNVDEEFESECGYYQHG